jgi:hypothetical protein
MIQRPDLLIFFDNAAEGSWTLVSQLQMLKLDELARQHRLYVIGGGDMEDAYKYIRHDHFLSVILNYDENIDQIEGTDVKLHTFPDGHMSHIENQAELLAVLNSFLKRV